MYELSVFACTNICIYSTYPSTEAAETQSSQKIRNFAAAEFLLLPVRLMHRAASVGLGGKFAAAAPHIKSVIKEAFNGEQTEHHIFHQHSQRDARRSQSGRGTNSHMACVPTEVGASLLWGLCLYGRMSRSRR